MDNSVMLLHNDRQNSDKEYIDIRYQCILCLSFLFFERRKKMKIRKILNNNVAVVAKGGHESIVFSTGLSFRKKIGDKIKNSEIEKMYVLDSKERLEHFSYLLAKSEDNTIDLVNEIVQLGEKQLDTKLNDYLYLALLDHINFAYERSKKEQFILNPLMWEVKKFYPEHYKIGQQTVMKMKQLYKVDFPEDEAVSIALHFINAQDEKNYLDDKIDDMETLRDILNIIKYHFNINFDENSMMFVRLVTHLQFFISRVKTDSEYNDTDTLGLYDQVRTLYPSAYDAVMKINHYVEKKYNYILSQSESTYLMIHINRLLERNDLDGI